MRARAGRRLAGTFLLVLGAGLLTFSGALTAHAQGWGASPAPLPMSGEGSAPARPRPGEQPPSPDAPVTLLIPAISLASPIRSAPQVEVDLEGRTFRTWDPPVHAVGHHEGSALPGQEGNVVLSGHNNAHGAVFRRLERLQPGDLAVLVSADGRAYPYRVVERRLLAEEGQPLAVRSRQAQLLERGSEPRLTLVTCWPYWRNSHRLIVTAEPLRAVPSGPRPVWPVSAGPAPAGLQAAGLSGAPAAGASWQAWRRAGGVSAAAVLGLGAGLVSLAAAGSWLLRGPAPPGRGAGPRPRGPGG